MTTSPIVLASVSPTELLTYILNHCRYPTTVVIGSTRQGFSAILAQDALPAPEVITTPDEARVDEPPPPTNALLRHTLLQMAVSRHIRIVFMPSVTHFRAWTSVFFPADSPVPAPPTPDITGPPTLLVYGMVALHRDTSEWSAQGLGASVAGFVDAAARHGFRAVVMEPKEAEMDMSADGASKSFADEKVPLLKGMAMREDGTWAGRTVEVRRILGRWFHFDDDQDT